MPSRSPTPLFDEPIQARTGPLGWIEPALHWFTESTRPEAVASRQTVNGWYKDFPDVDGKFAARLRSEVNVDHYQALDELYVHHILRQTHDDVHYEVGEVGRLRPISGVKGDRRRFLIDHSTRRVRQFRRAGRRR